jgi:hypothetical protein
MLLRGMMITVLAAGMAQAQEAEVPTSPGASTLIEAMPAKRLKALKASPEGFLEDAAEVIYAAGQGGRIDAAGLETFIALRRAEVRARRIGFFLAADLDNDGAISRNEAGLFAASLNARRRGGIQWGFDLADADMDGSLTMAELRIYAETEALQEVDEIDAAGLRSLMLFDLNNDGVVAMDEVVTAVSALQGK